MSDECDHEIGRNMLKPGWICGICGEPFVEASKLDSLRQNLAVAHSILNDAMAEQDYHVDVSRTAVWLASNEGVVERGSTSSCGAMFPPGQFAVQQCTLPKGHAGEHANNVKGL